MRSTPSRRGASRARGGPNRRSEPGARRGDDGDRVEIAIRKSRASTAFSDYNRGTSGKLYWIVLAGFVGRFVS